MKRTTLLGALVLVSLFWQMAGAQTPAPPVAEDATISSTRRGERIVNFIKSIESQKFAGAVLAARDGVVVAAVAVGDADPTRAVRNTPVTLFEIASLTKQFTAAAALKLAMAKRIDLDDSISKHLPGIPDNCKDITIRHLLQHTSGISGKNSQGAGRDLEQVLPFFLKDGPQHPPGTHWEYWNQGYSLAAEVVSRASGIDYPDYCKRELFASAGMTHTLFTGDAAPEGAIVSIGTSTRGPSRSALAHPYGEYGFQYRGMGGAVTTVWDLWRWDRALTRDDVLTASFREMLFKPGPGEYALGWFVKTSAAGRLAQSHSGGVRGFCSEMRRFPTANACIIVLANRDDANPRMVADAVEQLLFDEPLTAWKSPAAPAGALEPALLDAIVGRYSAGKEVTLSVTADGGTARAAIQWDAQATLITRATIGMTPTKQLMLLEPASSTAITLTRDAEQKVTMLTIGNDLEFKRLP